MRDFPILADGLISEKALNGIIGEMVYDSAEFQALGPRMLATAKSLALESVKTGHYINSIKLTRLDTMFHGRHFSTRIRDWLVYSDDPQAALIEFGAVFQRGETTVVQKPHHVMKRTRNLV